MTKNKGNKSLSRKELRKNKRQQVKLARNQHSHKKQAQIQSKPTSLLTVVANRKASSKATVKVAQVAKTVDPFIAAEDEEIARLEKLLKIKDKSKSASKLNKEFELYEGMEAGFGDFLMDLDALTGSIEGKGERKRTYVDEDEDLENYKKSKLSKYKTSQQHHIIDESEQEVSDIDDEINSDTDEDNDDNDSEQSDDVNESGEDEEMSEDKDDDNEGDDESDEGQEDHSASEENEELEDENDAEEEVEEEDDDNDDDNEDDEDDGEDDGEDEPKREDLLFSYRPVKGEDIYGRATDNNSNNKSAGGKYVPPAKRSRDLLSNIDENSDNVRMIRRQMNGLMNKLSEQTKDNIVRSIKTIFDQNSSIIASVVLKDCIMAACGNPTQLMSSLIPIYASIVAALHFSIGIDVGAFIIESLTVSLNQAIVESSNKKATIGDDDDFISNKLPSNSLLLLVYLYNLRVLHHTLIVDIMNTLAGVNNSSSNNDTMGEFIELKVELLLCLINHCGSSIRSDDPVSLKQIITTLTKKQNYLIEQGKIPNSRVKFMFEALTDLKNNKSRRIQTENAEIVKGLRKWLGSIKNSLGTKSGDLCLRVTLKDLLDAEKRGRWWRAGASWTGHDPDNDNNHNTNEYNDETTHKKEGVSASNNKPKNTEEEKLLALATKLHMNTSIRKSIFVVLMSSRDVTDAFERISRLDLKGKQDREVARVVTECCGQEKVYNPFYAELAKTLCSQNRQYKTTFQFIYWDFFKVIEDDEEEGEQERVKQRKVVNLARLLSHLVVSFHIPLAVLKPLDMSNVSEKLVLFLSTFFLAMFKEKISDEDFQTVIDRVATTKDFATVRDNITCFLQQYMPSIPKGIDSEDTKIMNRRRKITLKTMQEMDVLDMARGMMDDNKDSSNNHSKIDREF